MLFIIKRDGRRVAFNKEKIENAVLMAFAAEDGDISGYAQEKANNIAAYIELELERGDHIYTVEEIQDLVERGLMSSKRKDVARAYITYRDARTRERNKNSDLIKNIGQKIEASNVQNQNANVDEHSFGGRRGEATNELMKQYALDYCMCKKSRENHLNNEIYIHKLNCA